MGKWRRRFLQSGCDGLLDEARPGGPRTVSDADVERVVTTTLESMPRDATHWSTRSMAGVRGQSAATVGRIWRAFALQLHRCETFKLSKDPLVIEKVRDVVGLYLHPPERAVGVARAPSPAFTCTSPPRSASWLNLVERWIRAAHRKQIRWGTHRNTAELEQATIDYFAIYNEESKPFVWTKTADQILESLQSYCSRISESGHELSLLSCTQSTYKAKSFKTQPVSSTIPLVFSGNRASRSTRPMRSYSAHGASPP